MTQQLKIKQEFFRKKRLNQQKTAVKKDKAYITVQTFLAQAQSGALVNLSDAADAIKDLYQVALRQINTHEHKYALYAISMGCLLNELKKQVKKQKLGNWIPWSEENLPFIKIRARQEWMRVAAENDAIRYAHLGISALKDIVAAIDDLYSKGKYINRLHAFFQESSYPYQEYTKTDDVKNLTLIHTFEVKAKREGLVFDIELVKALGEYPSALNDKLLEEMLTHQRTGNDTAVDNLLKLYILGKGKNPKHSGTTKGKSKQLSLDRALNNFDKVLDHYRNNFHSLGELRMEDIVRVQINLKDKISKLYWEKLIFDAMEP